MPSDRSVAAGYNYQKVAENIASESAYGDSDPVRAVHLWWNSPGHRANMVGPYTVVGYASCIGKYDGKQYYAQSFGYGDDDPLQEYSEGGDCAGISDDDFPMTSTAPVHIHNNAAPVYEKKPAYADAPEAEKVYGDDSITSYGPYAAEDKENSPAYAPSYGPSVKPVRVGPNGRPCIASKYGNKSPAGKPDQKRKSLASTLPKGKKIKLAAKPDVPLQPAYSHY